MGTVDAATRVFWRLRGRPVDLAAAENWLAGPVVDGGESWLGPGADTTTQPVGLLGSMQQLDGPGFAAERLSNEVRDFYEHTSAWQMKVRTRWSPWARPGGAAVSHLFGRRVQQLALPVAGGGAFEQIDSRVVSVPAAEGPPAVGWIRTLRSSGDVVYSGAYDLRTLPGAARPSVHVVFPLPQGNLQVFFEPLVVNGGALGLRSLGGDFGEPGTYVVVREHGVSYAARVPLHETFLVFVDALGALRTAHRIWLGSRLVVRLDYVMSRPG